MTAETLEDLRVWQRRHHPDIVAELTPGVDAGAWDVCVFRAPGHRDLVDDTAFGTLVDAQRAADALASATFRHRCKAKCGAWLESEPPPLDAGQ